MAAATELADRRASARRARRWLCRELPTTESSIRLRLRQFPGGRRHGLCVLRNGKRFSPACTKNVFRIALQPLFMRRYSMKGTITAQFAPCIACSTNTANSRTPQSVASSALPEARTDGYCSQSTLELGHQQAARPRQVDLLLSLCHPGRVQPLRYRLDGRLSRKRGVGQAADRGELQKTRHPARPTHAACRSWHLDEVQAGSFFTCRSGCHENA